MSRSRTVAVLVTVATIAAVVAVSAARFVRDDDARRHYLGTSGWPTAGQAAYAVDTGRPHAGPGQQPVPIASLAKVMTALLVLRAAPLNPGSDGFRLVVTARDVADLMRRAADDESVVPVRRGEVLTERQALAALLLPSANNVAIMLARRVAGSVRAFVAAMNATARRLGMRHTRYTDPSGLQSSTVSTAADQLVLAGTAMRNPTFAALVRLPSYPLPVGGTVQNTDTLLGTRGFVGIKTGSDDAAGGCFMFRAHRTAHGRRVTVTGVVLGQHGHNLISAGLYAGAQLVDHVVA
jgi:serine-type D-Ala-D-Ala carboxypeptidase (penicillin-binding protein 5/6)